MAFCEKCGSPASEGIAFCPQCGAPVGTAVPPPPAAPAQNWAATPPPPQPAQAWSSSTPPPQPAHSWSAPPPPPQPGQGWSASQPPPPPPPGAGWAPAPGAPVVPASGLQENVAGCLCYALGWLTGILFLLIDKRPFVRFHAAQSIVVFGALNLVRVALLFGFFGGRLFGISSLVGLLSLLVSLITLIAWLALMIFAYQGRRYEVPVAAGIANSIAGNPAL